MRVLKIGKRIMLAQIISVLDEWKRSEANTSGYNYMKITHPSIPMTLLVSGFLATATLAFAQGSLTPPVAGFTAGPTNGVEPLTVNFTNTSTGTITNQTWDFGDGVTSGVLNPSHPYTNAGVFTVTLTTSGPGGSNGLTRSNLISVIGTNIVYVPGQGRVSQIATGTGQRLVLSGRNLPASGFVAVDPTTGDLYTADQGDRAVYRVARTSGVVTLVSGPGVGSGPSLTAYVYGVAVETNGTILVVDGMGGLLAIIAIDPVTGNRSVFSAGSNSALPVGTGIVFQSPVGITIDKAGNPLVTDNYKDAVISIDPVSGNRTVVSGDPFGDNIGSGPALNNPEGITIGPDGSIYAYNVYAGQLVQIEPLTGNRSIVAATGESPIYDIALSTNGTIIAPYEYTVNNIPVGGVVWGINPRNGGVVVVSGISHLNLFNPSASEIQGTGPLLFQPIGVAVDNTGILIVSDVLVHSLFAIDPGNGNRGILPNSRSGTGNDLYAPEGIAVAPNGMMVIADDGDSSQDLSGAGTDRHPLLMQINLSTGNRSILSGGSNAGTPRGSGADFDEPNGVAFEASGTFLATDSGLINPKVVRIDPLTGNRSVLSSAAQGTGPNFIAPYGVCVGTNGAIIISDTGMDAVLQVDPTTGNRALLSGAGAGAGPTFSQLRCIAALRNGAIAVTDANLGAVLLVDGTTGNRAVISSATVGSGPNFTSPCGIAEARDGGLLVLDSTTSSLFNVDRNTGNRTIISSASVGSGPYIGESPAFLAIAPNTPPDIQSPALSINSPSNNITVNSQQLTVSGTATDSGAGNDGVSSVTVNGTNANGGSASGTNTANWSATVTLSLGQNVITVVASDILNNTTTQQITVIYALPDTQGPQLTINSPSNGATVINASLTVSGTATDSGFGNDGVSSVTVNGVSATGGSTNGTNTANWSALITLVPGINTITIVAKDDLNNPTQQSITVNYAPDTTRPRLVITSPTSANGQSGDGAFLAKGTANDNVQVASVWCEANGSPWTLASTANNWSNWTASVTLKPGTNIVAAYAVDTSENFSTTNTVKFAYVVTSPLTLITNGSGKINRNFTGNVLKVGSSYNVTAVAGSGDVFSNWSGSITSAKNPLTFIMQPSMVLEANFIPNPFLPVKGIYNGLFSTTNGVSEETAGMLSGLDVTASGTYTGKLLIGGGTNAISGGFNVSGQATNHVPRTAKQGGALTLEMTLNWNESPPNITGTVSGTNGEAWVANLTNELAVEGSSSAEYTALLLPTGTPPGYGYLLMSNHAGIVTLSGALADGTAFSQGVHLSGAGDVPVYGNLYGGTGLLLGWIGLESGSPTGNLTWIKKATRASVRYTNGFTNLAVVQGSPWTCPLPHTAAIDLPSGQLDISGGGLLSNLTFNVAVSSSNTLVKLTGSPTNSLSGAINRTNGLLTIKFGNGAGKATTTGTGAVLQNLNNGGGFFLGKTNAGSIFLQP